MTAFETSTVRPSPPGPAICVLANLPSFETWKQAADYLEQQCGGHMPVRAKWECSYCKGWHFWATAPTDSNGGCLAGSWHHCGFKYEPCDHAEVHYCRSCGHSVIYCGKCLEIIVSLGCSHWTKGKTFRA